MHMYIHMIVCVKYVYIYIYTYCSSLYQYRWIYVDIQNIEKFMYIKENIWDKNATKYLRPM